MQNSHYLDRVDADRPVVQGVRPNSMFSVARPYFIAGSANLRSVRDAFDRMSDLAHTDLFQVGPGRGGEQIARHRDGYSGPLACQEFIKIERRRFPAALTDDKRLP